LDAVYVTSLRAVEKWTAAIDGEHSKLVDFPRFGRPYGTGKVDAVRVLMEGERYLPLKTTDRRWASTTRL
jgi:hypothetical protein